MSDPTLTKKAPVGIRNNNPGNLRFNAKIAWKGQVGEGEGGFAKFVKMEDGIRASCKDLLSGFRQVTTSQGRDGEDTVAEIIREWAPSNENDTEAYIESVCTMTGFMPDQWLTPDKETLFALLRAIFRHENGGWHVGDDVIRAGIEEAFE